MFNYLSIRNCTNLDMIAQEQRISDAGGGEPKRT